MKGLRADIILPARGDSSNGGLSSKVTEVTVVGPGVPEIFEPSEDAPAVEIVTEYPVGRPMLRAYPLDREKGEWFMFGGGFIYTSDSRFSRLYGGPVKLFDRTE